MGFEPAKTADEPGAAPHDEQEWDGGAKGIGESDEDGSAGDRRAGSQSDDRGKDRADAGCPDEAEADANGEATPKAVFGAGVAGGETGGEAFPKMFEGGDGQNESEDEEGNNRQIAEGVGANAGCFYKRGKKEGKDRKAGDKTEHNSVRTVPIFASAAGENNREEREDTGREDGDKTAEKSKDDQDEHSYLRLAINSERPPPFQVARALPF